ncbi:hypothetical protein GCM10027612_25430 [Microbispora bryophytorum subsp. camponoti]
MRAGVRRARDDQHLRRALERVRQARGIVELALTDPYAEVHEVLGLERVADADADPVGGQTGEQALDDASAELTGRSGDDNHDPLLAIADIG